MWVKAQNIFTVVKDFITAEENSDEQLETEFLNVINSNRQLLYSIFKNAVFFEFLNI